jgi:uncharacterized Tic20 family protein
MDASSAPAAASSDDKIWGILSHLSLYLGVPLLLPLIIYLVKRQDNAWVSGHAKEALNFHITLFLYGLAGLLLCLFIIGIFFLWALGLAALVCTIIAGVEAYKGKFFRYPLTIRIVQ